jgi:hypothetical protein
MSSEKIQNSLIKEWLEKLQEESWQLELLISGFAIFGLFELRQVLVESMSYAQANNAGGQGLVNLIPIMYLAAYLGTYTFIINLLVHIFIRGLWIGAIGLRYVSGDIEYDELPYNSRIINFYKRTIGSFDDYIVKLEKFASVIFSYSFLLFFIFCSCLLFISELIVFEYFAKDWFAEFQWVRRGRIILILSVLGLGLIVMFDFLTLGLIKRIKQRHFSKVYFWIYKLVGWMTLSFLWRPLLLNFLDQKYTKRLIWFIIPYTLVIFFLPSNQIYYYEYFPAINENSGAIEFSPTLSLINKHSFNPVFYDDLHQKEKDEKGDEDYYNISLFSIPSYRIHGNVFEVFVKHNNDLEEWVARDSSLYALSSVGFSNEVVQVDAGLPDIPKERKEKVFERFLKDYEVKDSSLIDLEVTAFRDTLNKIFNKNRRLVYSQNLKGIKDKIMNGINFSIDGNSIPSESISGDFYTHPNAKEKGMLCFFPINLTIGRHSLEYKKLDFRSSPPRFDTVTYSIPFIYEGKYGND